MNDQDKRLVLHLLRERADWCWKTSQWIRRDKDACWQDGTVAGDGRSYTTPEYLKHLGLEQQQVERLIAELESELA